MRRFPVEFPSLETDRLTLRQVRIADLDRLRAIYGDPQVMRHASDPVFARAEHYVQTIEGMARGFSADQAVEWGMARRSDDVLIGTVGLHNFRETVAEVGCLLAAAYWRQGFMREAVGAVQAFAKERLGWAWPGSKPTSMLAIRHRSPCSAHWATPWRSAHRSRQRCF
ncbi:GNAT family N-acetyltransferase [Xanthomonas translucens]|uniref:GNAT family N-acetyltransferase n=1 Tax=Xanthomonas campestris pv. translucens TaxID=343 RepID=UPI00071E6FEC|nr:GNAT family N-acetyltransferase [Xanthomonas translucens]